MDIGDENMLTVLDEKKIPANQRKGGHIRKMYNSLWKKTQNSHFGIMPAIKILQQKNTTNLEKIVQIAACSVIKTTSIWKRN